MTSPIQRQTARLLGRVVEILDDLNAAMLELDPATKGKFARQFARVYELMEKARHLQEQNGDKGE